MDLKQKVALFLNTNKTTNKPLLLGFSGGEDSLALCHCLMSLGEKIHLAHFDHRWRSTSQIETQSLQVWAKSQGLVFKTAHGTGDEKTENFARNERYAFFQECYQEGAYEAVVLAHHRDDQVETILKRALEGATLTSLKGMVKVSQREGMTLLRPFLDVSKEEIRAYIKEHELEPIEDVTNNDPHYLRARLRHHIIPYIQKEFGKEVTSSLVRLGDYSAELQDFLAQSLEKFPPVEGPFGTMWDFSCAHPIEVRTCLSSWFKGQGVTLTHHIFETIFSALKEERANFKLTFSGQSLMIDRQYIFALKDPGPWTWAFEVKEGRGESEGWKGWWQGKISFTLPKGEYEFIPLTPKARKKLNQEQVPAFMRDLLPAIVHNQEVVGDCYQGLWKKENAQAAHFVEVRFQSRPDEERGEVKLGEKSKIML